MTDQEIVQALRACANGESEDCPFAVHSPCGCPGMSAELIARLSAENADLRKELEWKDMVIALAQKKQAEAEAERDAAIVDMKIFAGCATCVHECNYRRNHQESLLLTCCDCEKKKNCKCVSCRPGQTNWEWRGLPEAPEG